MTVQTKIRKTAGKAAKKQEEPVEIRGYRGKNSGVKLDDNDASLILGMIRRKDRKQDIAAYFGVNIARIYEIGDGRKFPGAKPADASDLPGPGPYLSGRGAQKARKTLLESRAALAEQIARIDAVLEELNQEVHTS